MCRCWRAAAVGRGGEGADGQDRQIWALFPAGNSRSEIAGFLGIRYQRVRNVLVQSGITQTQFAQIMPIEAVLQLAAMRGLPAVTADRAWAGLDVGVEVRLIRD